MLQNEHNINATLEVQNTSGEYDLSDSLENISFSYGFDSIFPEITLQFDLNTDIAKKINLGNYTEQYRLTLVFPNLTDRSRQYVFELAPIEYTGLNILDLGSKDSHSIKATVRCIFSNINNMGHAESKIWKDVKLKDILTDLCQFVTTNFELDEPEIDKKFKQFFLPYQKLYYAFPYVLSYTPYSSNLYTIGLSWKGLHVYRLEKAADRGEIEITLYDDEKYSNSNKYAVSKAEYSHSPLLKFQTGGVFRVIHPDSTYSKIEKYDFFVAYQNENFDFIGLYDGQLSKPYIVQRHRKLFFNDSVIETKDRQHLLTIHLSNPIELESTIPLFYKFNVTFTDEYLSKYSKDYYALSTQVSISRKEQAYRMNTTMTLVPNLRI